MSLSAELTPAAILDAAKAASLDAGKDWQEAEGALCRYYAATPKPLRVLRSIGAAWDLCDDPGGRLRGLVSRGLQRRGRARRLVHLCEARDLDAIRLGEDDIALLRPHLATWDN